MAVVGISSKNMSSFFNKLGNSSKWVGEQLPEVLYINRALLFVEANRYLSQGRKNRKVFRVLYFFLSLPTAFVGRILLESQRTHVISENLPHIGAIIVGAALLLMFGVSSACVTTALRDIQVSRVLRRIFEPMHDFDVREREELIAKLTSTRENQVMRLSGGILGLIVVVSVYVFAY